MSRAFVNEDATHEPEPRYVLPERESPHYDRAAAWALIEGANEGNTASAEKATGYQWGESGLVPYVRDILAEAQEQDDARQRFRIHRLHPRQIGRRRASGSVQQVPVLRMPIHPPERKGTHQRHPQPFAPGQLESVTGQSAGQPASGQGGGNLRVDQDQLGWTA